jgi:hypothetical protein
VFYRLKIKQANFTEVFFEENLNNTVINKYHNDPIIILTIKYHLYLLMQESIDTENTAKD